MAQVDSTTEQYIDVYKHFTTCVYHVPIYERYTYNTRDKLNVLSDTIFGWVPK